MSALLLAGIASLTLPADCDELIEPMDENAILHFHQGQTWLEMEQYGAALREFEIGIHLQPSGLLTAALYNDAGEAYLKLGILNRAIQAFQAAIHYNPAFSVYYENLARVYQKAEALPFAQSSLERDLKKHPQRLQAWYLLGVIHQLEGNSIASRQAFETFLQLAPHSELAAAAKLNLSHLQVVKSDQADVQ